MTNEVNMRTQIAVFVLELVILGGLTAYVQYRYARANYPNSPQWKWVLFMSGFIPIAVSLATFLYQKVAGHDLLLFSLLGGLFTGLIFTFLFPHNMRNIYPKRDDEAE